MTRKYFQLIADVIKVAGEYLTIQQQEELAADFADALAHTNPQFNRTKFIRAALHGHAPKET